MILFDILILTFKFDIITKPIFTKIIAFYPSLPPNLPLLKNQNGSIALFYFS